MMFFSSSKEDFFLGQKCGCSEARRSCVASHFSQHVALLRSTTQKVPLYDEGKSEYNFGLHQKNYRGGLDHTLGDQNQPLFKSPYGSP